MLNVDLYMLNHFLKDDSDCILTRIFKFRFLLFILAISVTIRSEAMDRPVYQPTAWYEWQSFLKQQGRVYERQKGMHKVYVKLQDAANQEEFHSPVIRYSDSDSEDCTDN